MITQRQITLTGVRAYSDQELQNILDTPALYNPAIVEQCKSEVKIRQGAKLTMLKMVKKSDEELLAIIDHPENYSEVELYCSQKILIQRQQKLQKQAQTEAEQTRLVEQQTEAELKAKRELETHEKPQKHKTFLDKKKWAFVAVAVAVVLVIVVIIAVRNSTSSLYNRALKYTEQGECDKAIELYKKINNKRSDLYSVAKYNLYALSIYENRDSLTAAQALIDAVEPGNWSDIDAYGMFVTKSLSGDLAPYLPKDSLRAAEVLELADNEYMSINAGAIYLDLKEYDKALEIFERYPSNEYAKGYLGIMHFYGLKLERDALKAWEYLQDAPDEMPFVVHKGDLQLILRLSGNFYAYVKQADHYYTLAQLLSSRQDIADKCNCTHQILSAYNNSPGWNLNNRPHWNNWNFNGGMYHGMTIQIGNEQYAEGWGLSVYNSKQENTYNLVIRNYGIDEEKGLFICNDHRMFIGIWDPKTNYKNIKEGTLIDAEGSVHVTTYNRNSQKSEYQGSTRQFCPEIVISYFDEF